MTGVQVVAAIIGGLITLTVLFVVQAVIVPRVQAYTRRRERWEEDMAELEALVEEKLPRAISGLKRESMVLRLLLLEGPNPRDPTIEGLRSATVSRQRKADKAVGKQMARLLVLESRVKRIHKHSPYWGRLFMSYVRLRLEQHAVDLVTMDLVDLTRISDEDWADRWQKIEQRRADLAKIIRSVTETMKPPPRQFVYRVRQRLRDRKRRSLQNASAPPA